MSDDPRDALVNSLGVSRETIGRLEEFGSLLRKWNPRINLVATSTLPELWTRHFLDSAQLARYLTDDHDKVVDLGSGGGFPALVLAILSKDSSPDRKFALIESDHRKAAFLNTAIRTLDLSATVHTGRVETVEPQLAPVVTARAFAPLNRLMLLAHRHLNDNGMLILLKGANFQEELEQARKIASFSVDVEPSIVNSEGVVLLVTQLKLRQN